VRRLLGRLPKQSVPQRLRRDTGIPRRVLALHSQRVRLQLRRRAVERIHGDVDLPDRLDEPVLRPEPADGRLENVRHHRAGLGLDSDAYFSVA
jgi:hypothetical protein